MRIPRSRWDEDSASPWKGDVLELRAQLSAMTRDRNAYHVEAQALTDAVAAVTKERDDLRRDSMLRRPHGPCPHEVALAAVTKERDEARREFEAARDHAYDLIVQREALRVETAQLRNQRDEARAAIEIDRHTDDSKDEIERLVLQRDGWQAQYELLAGPFGDLRKENARLGATLEPTPENLGLYEKAARAADDDQMAELRAILAAIRAKAGL